MKVAPLLLEERWRGERKRNGGLEDSGASQRGDWDEEGGREGGRKERGEVMKKWRGKGMEEWTSEGMEE